MSAPVRLTVAAAASAAGAKVHLPAGVSPASLHAVITSVGIDSRKVAPGQLFVALAGERVDGHDFVADALAAGAAAAMVSRPVAATGPLLVVDDPYPALARLAGAVRSLADPDVVGITGSTGKTSTKDLLAAVAAVRFSALASYRSENNELGVPLTLLRAIGGPEVLICELGARGPGQIAELCGYVRPRIGVVTNVGRAHYELFGSAAAIVAAKSELPASLPAAQAGGVAVLNADDPNAAAMAQLTQARVLTYGTSRRAWLRAESVTVDGLGRPTFRMIRGSGQVTVTLAVSGIHQVHNALAAGAAGLVLGLTLDEVAEGLGRAQASPWRMEVTRTRAGGWGENPAEVVVVNDAYNANPASVAAALETCAAMVPAGGRLVAVLGAMAELGAIEVTEHERVGVLAAKM
ncbi:MAG TPA: UDP-N-acetylmuramoyl-tripeptide--D-alanyl-D-alanine ligase, partial [Actinomycetota bacterium]|nr:UDP-N-acetylmuramoyl-tripeptide--D-alanyl-D-alanine ligase [Actinomycetota bacterium]